MSTLAKTLLTPEQYLEIDRKAEFRSEYYQGEMFAMSGATEDHNLITDNLVVATRQQLRGRPCRSYSRDMRVQVPATGLYTYPDLAIACGERKFLDARRDTLLNPVVIIEVLSESTEACDRGQKFTQYRTIESLQEYVLVSQDRVQVERYRRQPGNEWLLTARESLKDTLQLDSVGCTLRLADIYEDLNSPAAETGQSPVQP